MAKQKRINTFTVDAQSVQGIEGATITFRRMKRREWLAWRKNEDTTDDDLVDSHVVEWTGFVDENGNDLPSLKDEPEALGEVFFDETRKIVTLLIQGPDGPDALKN